MNAPLNNYAFIKNLMEAAPEQKSNKDTVMILTIILGFSTAAAIYFYVEMKKKEAQFKSPKQTVNSY